MNLWHEKTEAELRDIWRPWGQQESLYAFGLSDAFRGYDFQSSAAPVKIRAIFDNNPALQNSEYRGLPMRPPSSIAKGMKLIVFPADYYSISAQLTALGLAEYVDFMPASDFILLHQWFARQKVHFHSMAQAVTLRCTLRCLDCTMLVTEQVSPPIYPAADLINEADTIMRFVDQLQFLGLIGGEPFLNRGLAVYLRHLREKYCGRIHNITITTNGTIIPDEQTLAACLKYGVTIDISDYSAAGIKKYAAGLNRLAKILAEASISFRVLDMPYWIKRYADKKAPPLYQEEEAARRHYGQCLKSTRCVGWHGTNLYPCYMSFSADQCGWVPCGEGDFLDVTDLDPQKKADRFRLVKTWLGQCENGGLSLCSRCYGNNPATIEKVPPARQCQRDSRLSAE